MIDVCLTYGEVELEAFWRAFTWIQKTYKGKDPDCWHNAFNKPGGIFMDLGHGTGKGVLIGSLIHQFERSCGIEFLQNLHTESTKLKAKYDQYIDEVNELEYQRVTLIPHCYAPKFEVVHGDILKIDWSAADLVFANSTCFDLKLMRKIEERAMLMKKGSWMITTTKKLPGCDSMIQEGKAWECALCIKMKMSWGFCTVNIHRKIEHPPVQKTA